MFYRICPDCGAYLDPDERCDCLDELIASALPKKKKPRSVRPVRNEVQTERSDGEALRACG